MARTRINVSIPRFTFLSWAINSMIRSRPGQRSGNIGRARRQTHLGEVALHPLGLGRGHKAAACGEFEGEHHAYGNRFAVQQPIGKSAGRFQGMTESMTEIEERALAGLALVTANDRRLGAARHRHGMFARGIARRACAKYVAPMRFQPGKERGIAKQAVFHQFGIAGAEFALRQRVKERGIGDNQDRLVECPDQIFPLPESIAVLPPTEEST